MRFRGFLPLGNSAVSRGSLRLAEATDVPGPLTPRLVATSVAIDQRDGAEASNPEALQRNLDSKRGLMFIVTVPLHVKPEVIRKFL